MHRPQETNRPLRLLSSPVPVRSILFSVGGRLRPGGPVDCRHQWLSQTRSLFVSSAMAAACLVAATIVCSAAVADEPAGWGSLRGRFLLKGDVPEQELLDITRDEDVCGPHQLRDESLRVDPESRGIANIVLWIDSRTEVPVHPDLKEFSEEKPLIDNQKCRFEPRIVRLRVGESLQISNTDPIAHNVAVYCTRNQPFATVIPQGDPLEHIFKRAEPRPVRVDCSIHAWMRSYLVITEHPYSAVSQKTGEFELKNLPAGEWKFRFWQERIGYLPSTLLSHPAVTQDEGFVTIKVTAGETVDLGDLQLTVSDLTPALK
ncbi:MAG: hypothetical protein KDA96_17675 [Planctomycetaceae bacterium]|nr:hypothetical protein [Planctomycetaceae bacterium]